MLRVVIIGILACASVLWASNVPQCQHLLSGRDFSSVAQQLNGGNPLKPTAESLLGQYLAETGAKTRTFRFNTQEGEEKGPEKLLVAVSSASFDVFRRLFGETNPNVMEHLHTPKQGTLVVRWMTRVFSMAQVGDEWRFPTVGSIGPLVLLSDSEAGRLHSYWSLNEGGTHNGMGCMPWQVNGYGYPIDGYGGNCTAWFGHIPLGDETSRDIVSPGSLDQHGDGQGDQPRTGTLQPYEPQNAKDAELYKRVWQVDLNRRLFDLLQVPFEEANHTNPGWVAVSLTALALEERIPFVVVYVNDHTQEIPEAFDPQIQPV